MMIQILAGIAIILFSMYMLWYAIKNFQKSAASFSWPRVEGKLDEVQLWGKRNIDGEMKDADHLNVKYSYSVDGKKLTGSNVTFFTLVYPETVEFAQKHPCHSSVTVYYNPDNPSESVLVAGHNKKKPYSDIILGSLGVLVGAIVFVWGILGNGN